MSEKIVLASRVPPMPLLVLRFPTIACEGLAYAKYRFISSWVLNFSISFTGCCQIFPLGFIPVYNPVQHV